VFIDKRSVPHNDILFDYHLILPQYCECILNIEHVSNVLTFNMYFGMRNYASIF